MANIQANTGVAGANAALAAANVNMIGQQIKTQMSQEQLNQVQANLTGQNLERLS